MGEKIEIAKNFIKKHGWKILIAIGIILIPFITEYIIRNGLYRPNSFKNEEWFSFMGSYLGAVVTVIVMYTTFRKSDKDKKRELQFQLRKRTLELQKETIKRISNILMITNYSLISRYSISDEISRFSGDLQSISLLTFFAKYDEYRTKERDDLLNALLEIQAEHIRILKEFQEKSSHVDYEGSEEQRTIEMIRLGGDLKRTVVNRREQIEFLLDLYLKSIEKNIYI